MRLHRRQRLGAAWHALLVSVLLLSHRCAAQGVDSTSFGDFEDFQAALSQAEPTYSTVASWDTTDTAPTAPSTRQRSASARVAASPRRLQRYTTDVFHEADDGTVALFQQDVVLKRSSVFIDAWPDLQALTCEDAPSAVYANATQMHFIFARGDPSNATALLNGTHVLGSAEKWGCAALGAEEGGLSHVLVLLDSTTAASQIAVTALAVPQSLQDALMSYNLTYFNGDPTALQLSQQLGRYPSDEELRDAINANNGSDTVTRRRLLDYYSASEFYASSASYTLFNRAVSLGQANAAVAITGSLAGSYFRLYLHERNCDGHSDDELLRHGLRVQLRHKHAAEHDRRTGAKRWVFTDGHICQPGLAFRVGRAVVLPV